MKLEEVGKTQGGNMLLTGYEDITPIRIRLSNNPKNLNNVKVEIPMLVLNLGFFMQPRGE